MDMTINTMWGIKFESVMEVVEGRSTYLGMKMKIMINMIGTIRPIIE